MSAARSIPLQAEAERAIEALLDLVERHEGTDSSKVAERLICAAACDRYTFRLSSLFRFDAGNLGRAMTVIEHVGRRSGAFSDWLLSKHRGRVERVIEKNRASLASEAREALRALER